MALPLFGGQQQKSSKNLVEFKAGKLTQKGKMVHPDTRKGQIYVYKSDDSLTHFCWRDRTTGDVVDDLIIFPEDADFSRVTQCTTGRVYIMKFRSSNRRFFCWMQEASEEKDEEYCRKVNEVLNGSSVAVSSEEPTTTVVGGTGTTTTTAPATPEVELAPTNLQAALGTPVSSRPNLQAALGTPVSSRPNGNAPVSIAALQNILNTLPSNGSAPAETVTPANVISREAIEQLLSCPETVSKLEEHLPEGLRGDPDSLRQTLNSPQFQQGLQLFSAAFKSGQLGPLMKSLGFTDRAGNAAAGGNFEAFVKAVAEATKEQEQLEEKEQAVDEDMEQLEEKEDMALD